MAPRLTSATIQNIRDVVDQYPDGATIEQIALGITSPPERRTLQHWLEMIVEGKGLWCDPNTLPVRYRASAPVESTTTSTAATTPNVSPSDAAVTGGEVDFTAMANLAIPTIVAVGMTQTATVVALRDQAAKNGKTGEAIDAYVAYVQSRLQRLAPTDVKAISAETFETWRRRYLGIPESSPAQPPRPQPELEPADEPTIDEPSDASVPQPRSAPRSRPRREPKPQPIHAPVRESAPVGVAADAMTLSTLNAGTVMAAAAREMGDIGKALNVGEDYARGKRTLLQTLSGRRALVAWMWGTVAILLTRSVPVLIVPHITTSTLGLYQVVSFAVVVGAIALCGAPWLFFRWRDAKKAGAPLTGGDVFSMLALGGLVTFAAARITVSVLSMVGA